MSLRICEKCRRALAVEQFEGDERRCRACGPPVEHAPVTLAERAEDMLTRPPLRPDPPVRAVEASKLKRCIACGRRLPASVFRRMTGRLAGRRGSVCAACAA